MSALKKVDWKRTASAYFWITVGSILYGFAFDWFYTPNLIGYGGITGVGQVVNVGDVIGTVGSTGQSSGNHLHFEMRQNGVRVNPLNYISPS